MNHPNREELAAFVYEDLEVARQAEVAGHLTGCAECARQVESWQGVRRELAGWRVAAKAPAAGAGVAWFVAPARWAAAAAFFMVVGFVVARIALPRFDEAGLRAGLAGEIRQELQSELNRHAAVQAAAQGQYQEAMTRALGRIEAQRMLDYARLREDVETVAVRAQGELINTRQEMLRLAGWEGPVDPSRP